VPHNEDLPTVATPAPVTAQEPPRVASESEPDIIPPAAEKLCRVCKKAMPAHGLKCTECNSFQNWRRVLSFSTEILALLIALISVLGIVLPEYRKWSNRHSDTQVRIVGASQDDLLVVAINTGREPSTVFAFHASFLNVPLDDADLIPVDPGEFLVPAEGSHIVHLRPRRLTQKAGSDVAAVKEALRRGTLKLVADIKESTDERPAEVSPRSADYPTANLSSWIKTYIPGMQ
jgi:predicted nucleic acid-binding Zn ribbon protein